MENLPPISNSTLTQMICMHAFNNSETTMSFANTKILEFLAS